VCGLHVARRVADHHHPAVGERAAEVRGAARRTDADQPRPLLVIAAEAPEREAVVQPEPLELGARAGAHVAGAEPDRDLGAGRGRVEQRFHSWMHQAVGGAAHLVLERRHVGCEQASDGIRVHRNPGSGEPIADDRRIGHAGELEVVEHVRTLQLLGERAYQRAAAGALHRHQRSVDVEQQDGRSHLGRAPTVPARERSG
jgi:hypothetical protein